jgi:anti-sigma regulatory factor (Ser/Thr protein kinase)
MLVGWQVAAYYQPAQEIGGDFYDFLYFPDGRVGFVIGDVTDKGIPAALVMAATRTLLRTVAQRLVSPGQVLERVNDLLCPDIPPKMFVTCLYALLNPSSGHLQYANAGHNLPCLRTISGIIELRATGMPLGLMPGMRYEEKDVTISSNESVLFYTDGLVEAHNSADDMFSGSRLRKLVVDYPASGAALIDFLLAELTRFTGADWEQEDDVTLVTLERVPSPPTPLPGRERGVRGEDEWRTLADFSVASQPGNEREAIEAVIQAVQEFHLSKTCLERLSTAVAEATMNAIEHGNKNRPEAPVQIQVLASETTLSVRITDQGGGQPIPDPEIPNLEAKLAGLQTPRGWGLFLIKNLMDDLVITGDESHHTLELILHLEGGKYICQPDSSR